MPRVYEDVPEAEIDSGKWELLSWSCQPGDVIAFQGLKRTKGLARPVHKYFLVKLASFLGRLL